MGILELFGFKSLKDRQQRVINTAVQQVLSNLTISPNYKVYDNADRYCTTDDVYSIINRIATTTAMIPLLSYIKEADKTLTETEEGDPLFDLLESPFEGMTKFESLYAIAATILMQGESIIYKEVPEFGPDKGKVIKLHYLEPYNVRIKVTAGFPRKILFYQYTVNGVIILDNIPPSEIIHTKYFNPEFGITGNELRGLSPLKVLTKRLTRIDSNNDVATAQLQNGGVPGILYEKGSFDDVADVLGKRKKALLDYFTNRNNVGVPYVAAGDMGWIEMGLKLVDLQVADLAKIDFKKLCNAFSVSDRLFNNDATGSEISDKSARVGLYTDSALPLVMRIRDSFNKSLVIHFKDKKRIVKEDISEIPELQKNIKEMADAFAALPIMIPAQIMDAFKIQKTGDMTLLENVYVKSGYQLLEDLTMPDLTLTGDYNKPKN